MMRDGVMKKCARKSCQNQFEPTRVGTKCEQKYCCRACKSAYAKVYWTQKRQERTRSYWKTWYAKNREREKAKKRAYYQATKAARRAKQQAWNQANRERRQEATRQWRLRNPEKMRAMQRRARAKARLKKLAQLAEQFQSH